MRRKIFRATLLMTTSGRSRLEQAGRLEEQRAQSRAEHASCRRVLFEALWALLLACLLSIERLTDLVPGREVDPYPTDREFKTMPLDRFLLYLRSSRQCPLRHCRSLVIERTEASVQGS